MEFRSDLTNLHSVVWNYFTRNEEKTEASCNLCLKDGVEKTVNRDHKGGGCAGYTFNNTKMRRHLENSHGVNLKKVKYSETDENTPNKRVGMKKERRMCPFCHHTWSTFRLQSHWVKGFNGPVCPERSKYFSKGLATVFNDDDDEKALKDFEDYNTNSVNIENGNYEVYCWLRPTGNTPNDVLYIGYTGNPEKRIWSQINKEFVNQHKGENLTRLVVKRHMSSSSAQALETSIILLFEPYMLPLNVKTQLAPMDITGFTFWDLQKAAKAILCSALSSATRQQYQIADSARKSKKPSKSVPKYGTLAFERKRAKHYREKNAVLKENNRKLQEIINGANLDTKFALNALGLSPTKSVSSIATTFMSPSRSLSAISSTSTTPLLGHRSPLLRIQEEEMPSSSLCSEPPVTPITPMAKISIGVLYDADTTPKISNIRRLDQA